MKKNSKISLGSKIRIKTTLDILFIFVFVSLILVSGLILKLGRYDAILLTIALLIYTMQYEITRKWVSKSIETSINEQVEDTSRTTNSISECTKKQKEGLENYVQLTESAISTTEFLKDTSNKTKETSQTVSDKVTKSLEFSQKEQEAVQANIEKMITLRQKIRIIAELILELSEHTQQIGDTVGIVEDIAEQTNMLALNAAVEAARAGENGKGFSVVAGEIRKLADESKQATMKITSLIKDIQQATNSTVMATEEGSKEIESGVKLADNINTNIEALINIISEIKTSSEEIFAEAENQTNFSTNINAIVYTINDGLKSSLKFLEENIENINTINELSNSFKAKIN